MASEHNQDRALQRPRICSRQAATGRKKERDGLRLKTAPVIDVSVNGKCATRVASGPGCLSDFHPSINGKRRDSSSQADALPNSRAPGSESVANFQGAASTSAVPAGHEPPSLGTSPSVSKEDTYAGAAVVRCQLAGVGVSSMHVYISKTETGKKRESASGQCCCGGHAIERHNDQKQLHDSDNEHSGNNWPDNAPGEPDGSPSGSWLSLGLRQERQGVHRLWEAESYGTLSCPPFNSHAPDEHPAARKRCHSCTAQPITGSKRSLMSNSVSQDSLCMEDGAVYAYVQQHQGPNPGAENPKKAGAGSSTSKALKKECAPSGSDHSSKPPLSSQCNNNQSVEPVTVISKQRLKADRPGQCFPPNALLARFHSDPGFSAEASVWGQNLNNATKSDLLNNMDTRLGNDGMPCRANIVDSKEQGQKRSHFTNGMANNIDSLLSLHGTIFQTNILNDPHLFEAPDCVVPFVATSAIPSLKVTGYLLTRNGYVGPTELYVPAAPAEPKIRSMKQSQGCISSASSCCGATDDKSTAQS